MPCNAAFMNGTVKGKDVWIPMDCILGGQERITGVEKMVLIVRNNRNLETKNLVTSK
jgi:hypothetical protein